MSSSPTTCCGPASCWSRRAPASTWAPTTTSGWSPCRRWRSWSTPSTGSATTWPPSGAEAPGSDPGGLAHPGAVHGAGAVGSVALLLLGALRGGSCPGHPLAGDAHHVLGLDDLDTHARLTLGVLGTGTELLLMGIQRHPAVQVVYCTPRSSSRRRIASVSRSGAGSRTPEAMSSSRDPMVSIASDLVAPIRPTGPRLIQPLA